MMAAGQILPYIDMPLQHGAPTVLQRMKRPAASEKHWTALRAGEISAPTSRFALLLSWVLWRDRRRV